MNKVDAMQVIVNEARQSFYSQASVKRTIKALKCIGYDGEELVGALYVLDICTKDGTPCYSKTKRTW